MINVERVFAIRQARVVVVATVLALLGVFEASICVYLSTKKGYLFSLHSDPLTLERKKAGIAYLAVSLGQQFSVFICRTRVCCGGACFWFRDAEPCPTTEPHLLACPLQEPFHRGYLCRDCRHAPHALLAAEAQRPALPYVFFLSRLLPQAHGFARLQMWNGRTVLLCGSLFS